VIENDQGHCDRPQSFDIGSELNIPTAIGLCELCS
jgi:hypothetical protein